jgi:dipeptidyl aminopeptidase/acylaminoacyl peptidase
MNRTALIARAFAVFLCAGTLLAQTPTDSTSNMPAVPGMVRPEAHTLTPEDVLSIRELDELRLSPDGKRIAFVVREPGDPKLPRQPRPSNIWIVPSDGSERPRPLVPALKNAYSPLWSPDGRTLSFLSDRRVEVNSSAGQTDQVHLLRVDGGDRGQIERLTAVPGGVEQFAWSRDGKMIAFVARDQATSEEQQREAAGYDAIEVDRNFKNKRLWITNLSDGKAVQVTKQDFEINELAWSPKGDELALVVARTPKPEDSLLLSLVIVNRSSGDVARTLSTNAAPISGLLRWSPDGRSITLLEGPPTKEFASWLAVVPAGGGSVRPLMKDYSGTMLSAEWTPDSQHLMAQSIEGTREALLMIDSVSGAVHKLADVIQSQWDASFSTNGQAIVYLAQTPESPSDIWVLTKDGPPRKITDFNPQTKSWRLGRVRELEWKNSKDGLIRRGVLITPPGYQPGNLYPTVVNTHPGDTAWWPGLHAKWWAWGQLLASNGYVVFLPNTRGVTGEGGRLHATTEDWGGMAFQDLMDGVDYLVAQRIADPNRLGIGGWSNGGFMTEYAITRTTRFKAAVAQAGHSDFFSLHGTSPYMHVSHYISTPDSPYHNRKWYDDHSPITFIRNCRTPTLLIHGINDGGVPVGQAYEFHTGLRDVGVETEMVVYPRERHSIQEYAHQLDLQKRVVAWFDKHLKR